jgi:hypothetical protein
MRKARELVAARVDGRHQRGGGVVRHAGRPEAYLRAASKGAALALIDQSDGMVGEKALWTRQRER